MHGAGDCESGIGRTQLALYRQALVQSGAEAAKLLWHREAQPADSPKYFKPLDGYPPFPICSRRESCNLVGCAGWEQVLDIRPDTVKKAISSSHEALALLLSVQDHERFFLCRQILKSIFDPEKLIVSMGGGLFGDLSYMWERFK
jgi:hypothetical protein